MKNLIVVIFGVFMFTISSSIFMGCDNAEKDQDIKQETNASYICSMDCEDGKTYEQAGQCPVCGMNLVELNTTEIEIE